MVNVTFIQADGTALYVEGQIGSSVMEAAIASDVPGILADCGGALSCATCHIHVRPEWRERIDPPGEVELAMLEMAVDPDERSRLACQLFLTSELEGLTVDVPRRQF